MTLELVMPDVVKMSVAFLRAQPEIAPPLVGAVASVRGKLIKNTVYPAVRPQRIASDVVNSRPFVVESVRTQFDCYGGNNRQAERLAQTVRSLLLERIVGYQSDGGTIVKVLPVTMGDLPDEEFEPVKERYIVEMDLWTRAYPNP